MHVLDLSDLIHAALVPSAFERSVQKHVHKLQGGAGADNSGAQAQSVRVVMHTGILCAEVIGAAGGADPFDLVGCNGDAYTGAAA